MGLGGPNKAADKSSHESSPAEHVLVQCPSGPHLTLASAGGHPPPQTSLSPYSSPDTCRQEKDPVQPQPMKVRHLIVSANGLSSTSLKASGPHLPASIDALHRQLKYRIYTSMEWKRKKKKKDKGTLIWVSESQDDKRSLWKVGDLDRATVRVRTRVFGTLPLFWWGFRLFSFDFEVLERGLFLGNFRVSTYFVSDLFFWV